MATPIDEQLKTLNDDEAQVWIIGTREQVAHTMNEMHQTQFVQDQAQFTPLMPWPSHEDKYLTVLVP